MFITERIIALSAIGWAIINLVGQVILHWDYGRDYYSVKVGSPFRGVIYNFTTALLPSHKESIRLHPLKFLIGLGMHIATFLALITALILLFAPHLDLTGRIYALIFFGIGILCGVYLFFRRIATPNLRRISTPDDYIALLFTIGFIITSLFHETGLVSTGFLLVYTAVLFFYLPLGKLKHALFFFIARAEFGARLGYRGIYPPGRGGE